MATTPPPSDRAPEKQTEPTRAGPPTPPPASGTGLPPGYAGIIAVLLVVVAIGGGLAIGTIARPRPTPPPTPSPTIATPTRTPVPTTDPRVFLQALSSGCVTRQGIWVVSNGGGLLRYDGNDWTQVDGTLRTLSAAACDERTLYAVGPVGAVLIVDDQLRQITSFDVTLEDLLGVAAMPHGMMAVGRHGTVMLLSGGSWQPYASGIDEDLHGLIVFSPQSAWVVGAQGISYRLEVAGWRPVPTGVEATLNAIAGPTNQSAVAVGDSGTIVTLSGATWSKLESRTDARLNAAATAGSSAWVVGDRGVVLTITDLFVIPAIPAKTPAVQRIDIGTTCTLSSVFVLDQDVWIVGSNGVRGGVWRLRENKVAERWGEC